MRIFVDDGSTNIKLAWMEEGAVKTLISPNSFKPEWSMTLLTDSSVPASANYEIDGEKGTVAKLAMRQPFVLFKGLTFQKLCLPGAFRPGDHHNKMLRPGLCVVHASPQYL